jgi:hypothetical protein
MPTWPLFYNDDPNAKPLLASLLTSPCQALPIAFVSQGQPCAPVGGLCPASLVNGGCCRPFWMCSASIDLGHTEAAKHSASPIRTPETSHTFNITRGQNIQSFYISQTKLLTRVSLQMCLTS